jgi:hypothetical protein
MKAERVAVEDATSRGEGRATSEGQAEKGLGRFCSGNGVRGEGNGENGGNAPFFSNPSTSSQIWSKTSVGSLSKLIVAERESILREEGRREVSASPPSFSLPLKEAASALDRLLSSSSTCPSGPGFSTVIVVDIHAPPSSHRSPSLPSRERDGDVRRRLGVVSVELLRVPLWFRTANQAGEWEAVEREEGGKAGGSTHFLSLAEVVVNS